MIFQRNIVILVASTAAFIYSGHGSAQEPQQAGPLREAVQGMATTFSANQQRLHAYQWLETTSVTVKGHSPVPKESLCKYIADGSIQKTPISQQNSAPSQAGGGALRGGLLRRAIGNSKKSKYKNEGEELKQLMGLYVPFNRAKFIDAARSGNVQLQQSEDNQEVIAVSNYVKKGDQVKLTTDRATRQILKIVITTYLEKASEKVEGTIRFDRMENGIVYPSNISIDAPTKSLSIRIMNANYAIPAQ